MKPADADQLTLTLEPMGKRVDVAPKTTVLQAAQEAGVDVMAVCGGMGTCGMCKVYSVSGKFSPVSLIEQEQLTAADLNKGLRLACEAQVLSHCTVLFPPETLATLQRLQLEGMQTATTPEPCVVRLKVDLSGISKSELDRAVDRILAEVHNTHGSVITFSDHLIPQLSKLLEENELELSLAVNDREIISVLPPDSRLVGYAVDIGTTKIAGFLVDLTTGQTLASVGATNPQIAYGEDIINRIKFANENPQGGKILQAILVQTVNSILEELRLLGNVSRDQIVDAVMVGNTAIHHMLLGLPVKPLGTAPYQTPATQSMVIHARDIGIMIAEGASIYLPPNIASFIGGDHVAMLLSTEARNRGGTILAVDIGTNTEISLINNNRHYSCSCASGPAFEGAHIREGMRAIPGAIEKMLIDGEVTKVKTIQNKPAIGICGSGVLDAVAELRRERLIDARGSWNRDDPRITMRGGKSQFVLVDAKGSGHGRDIAIDRNDINQIQLAKAAIRSGIEVLLQHAQTAADEVNLVLLAGAFGTYIDVHNAVEIGMFPRIPLERFQQVGNAAGSGARAMLISTASRRAAEQLVGQIEYIELMTEGNYTDIFMKAISFD